METNPNDTFHDALPDPAGDAPTGLIAAPPSRNRKLLKGLGWASLTVSLLLFFSLAKLPDQKIKAFIQGSIQAALASRGVTLSAAETRISYFFGIHFIMKDVRITPPPPALPGKIEELRISPHLFKLLLARPGASLFVKAGTGELKADGWLRPGNEGKLPGGIEISTENFDWGKSGLLRATTSIPLSLTSTGKLELSGDFSVPSSLQGEYRMKLSGVSAEAQSLMGFSVPKLSLSEGTLEGQIQDGKAKITALKLGKSGSGDDLTLTAEGHLLLGKSWSATTLDLKARFQLGESIRKAFPLIDALLGAGAQPDGSFAYRLIGPLDSPTPEPIKSGG